MVNNHKIVTTLNRGPKTKEDFILFNKFLSRAINNRKKDDKIKRCFLCGKKNIKYCDSHTLPRFVIKNIAPNGKIKNTQIFNPNRYINSEQGINNSGIFREICSKCDNTLFQSYENVQKYNLFPTDEMLQEIALKNYISRMYKHNKEKKFYNYVKNNLCSTYNEKRFIENSLKVTEFNYCYNKKWAKKCYKSLLNEKYHFKIHYYKELEYTVPYAIQAHCILFFDFNDKKLADNFIMPDYDTNEDMHLCIFPFKNKSIIFIFTEKDTLLYNDFFCSLSKKNEEEQLAVINFITFAYFEDVFLHEDLNSCVIDNIDMQIVSQVQPLVAGPALTPQNKKTILQENVLKESYSFRKVSNIPNLLLKEYKI